MPPYAGTMGAVRTAVVDRLKLDASADATRVLEWINLAYTQVVQETGCLMTCGTVALIDGESSYEFPPDVHWVKAIHYALDDGTIGRISVPLTLVSLDEVLRRRRQDLTPHPDPADPVYAVLGQNRFEIWPEPVNGSLLRFWYVYMPPALVNNSDTFLIKEPYGSKLLELGACVEGAKFKKDPLLQSYQQEYTEWMRRFQGWLNKRQTGTGGTMRVITGNERPTLSLVYESEAI